MFYSFFLLFSFTATETINSPLCKSTKIKTVISVYDSLHLSDLGLSKQAYTVALKGFQNLVNIGKLKNDSILSIIDFSLPSTAKRLFVLNIKKWCGTL